jgi:hypothetical protein
VAKSKDSRQNATCKRCGESLADKPTKQVYCSITCCNSDKIGIKRADCRVIRVCTCGKTGWGDSFWNRQRQMCCECAKVTPKKKPNGGHKNRVYKTCKCGFVGYGKKLFPFEAKGMCLGCWRKKTGYPIKITVKDQWDQWANSAGSEFFRYQRKVERNKGTPWDAWATQKSTNLVNRKLGLARKTVAAKVICGWDECFSVGMARIKQQKSDKELDEWTRKCWSWVRALATRQKQQDAKNFVS